VHVPRFVLLHLDGTVGPAALSALQYRSHHRLQFVDAAGLGQDWDIQPVGRAVDRFAGMQNAMEARVSLPRLFHERKAVAVRQAVVGNDKGGPLAIQDSQSLSVSRGYGESDREARANAAEDRDDDGIIVDDQQVRGRVRKHARAPEY